MITVLCYDCLQYEVTPMTPRQLQKANVRHLLSLHQKKVPNDPAHKVLSSLWQGCDGLAFFWMATCPLCRIFTFMSVLSLSLQKLPQKILNESMSFLFTMWTCGQGKRGQDLQTHTITSHIRLELLPYKAEYISTGDLADWSLLTQATQPSYYKQL